MTARSICGLDLGISVTDAVAGWAPETAVSFATRSESEPADAAIERLLRAAPLVDGELQIAATGVGSLRLPAHFRGAAVSRVDEHVAVGIGGTRLAERREALVVSIGTGTAIVSVRGDEIRPVFPGTGIGGGTLVGLAKALLGSDDLSELARLAAAGDRSRVDITIGEAVGGSLGALPAEATASHFAKYRSDLSQEDVAASLANLVAGGVLAATLLAMQATGQREAIFVGRVASFAPVAERLLEVSAALGDVLVIPPRAETATALGALWRLADIDGRSA